MCIRDRWRDFGSRKRPAIRLHLGALPVARFQVARNLYRHRAERLGEFRGSRARSRHVRPGTCRARAAALDHVGAVHPGGKRCQRDHRRSTRGRKRSHLPPTLRTMNAPPEIPNSPPLVSVENLCVNYGRTPAVRGISFNISRGEVFGFIGPNGAGKTSTIKVLATLLKPSTGRALVDGLDVVARPHAVSYTHLTLPT